MARPRTKPQARPEPAPPAQETPPSITFPQIARLELDQLLEQLVERAQDVMNTQGRLRGLLAATEAISLDLSLPVLLRRITQSACDLVGARYGALGVVGAGSRLTEFITVGLSDQEVERMGPLPQGDGILGLLISHPQPLRLDDLAVHPQSVGFPVGHPQMHSFVGVPIRIGSQVFGNLYLTDKIAGSDFTAEDQELLTSLAAAAGIAIDNARLYDVERRRQTWLTASATVSRELLATGNDPLPLIAAKARQVADADAVTITLPIAESPGLQRIAAADGNGAAELTGRIVPHDLSPAGKAAVAGGPVLRVAITDASGDSPGVMTLTRRPGGRAFDADEELMVAGFADQASLALKLSEAQAESRRLLLFEDRDRIARDLHDNVIQSLFAAGLGLSALAARTAEPRTREALVAYTEQLDDTIHAIRHTIFGLHRNLQTGLQARVLDVVRDVVPALGFYPDLRLDGPLDTLLDVETIDHVVAVLREALVNAARHARAKSVMAALSAGSGDVLSVIITDDGIGLNGHLRESGLANMRSRAEQLGGTCTITSPTSSVGGTKISWVVPLPARQQ